MAAGRQWSFRARSADLLVTASSSEYPKTTSRAVEKSLINSFASARVAEMHARP